MTASVEANPTLHSWLDSYVKGNSIPLVSLRRLAGSRCRHSHRAHEASVPGAILP